MGFPNFPIHSVSVMCIFSNSDNKDITFSNSFSALCFPFFVKRLFERTIIKFKLVRIFRLVPEKIYLSFIIDMKTDEHFGFRKIL